MFFFFKFLEVGGSSNLLLNNFIFTINIDLPLFYQCNSLIKSIDNADLLLTVGLHARKEASMLNVRIRKNFLNRELPVAHIGTFYAFTYPV